MSIIQDKTIAEQDKQGPPYTCGWSMDYQRALDIARSKHPSRVLANTNSYRYGKFEENRFNGEVTVHLLGQHIATFTPEGVRLWTRGYATPTTTGALTVLVRGGMFYTDRGVVYFREYADNQRADKPFEEGRLFPYEGV